MADKKVYHKPDEGTTVGATASFQSIDEGQKKELSSMLTEMFNNENEDELDSTFSACMADVELNKPINMEKLQTRFHYWSSTDQKAMKKDKSCIVCHKKEMDWPRYSGHLEEHHEIYQLEDRPCS